MAKMSDFHVVGDPRYAPNVPSGGGGVSEEYVDNADTEVKKTTAKGHNTKYDESVIPSQYTNKLYVYGNPESMYPASDIGGEIPAITGGHASVDYNWWGQQVSNWQQNDYKTYGYDSETDKIFDKLCVVKCISQADTRKAYYTILCTCDDQYITVNPNRTEPYLSLTDSHVAQKLYDQAYSGDPPTPQGYNLVTNVGAYRGGDIADFNYENNQYYDFEVSGIPLFVVNSNTQSEFDNINHYIATGDYSGAVNYSELYPDNPESYVAIDVISGDWYKVVNGAWVKQGTLDLNETGGTEVEANPQGTPTDTLNTIEIDGVIYSVEGGDVALSDLSDVDLDNLSNGQILIYNATAQKWENANESGGTPVVANPSGTATADLNKIQVDNTIYQIPQGGGGSGGVVPNPTGTPTETLETIGFNDILNDYYLENGLVGASGGSYVYCNLDKNMESGLTYKVILRDGSSVYTSEFGWEGSTKTINISGFELTVQSTKAGLTHYSGAYRNIYCDIYTEYTETTIYQIEGGGGGGASNLSDLSDVELSNLSDGQILQYNSTSEKWENANNQGSLPFEFVIDPTDNGINIVYDDSILNGGE